MINNIQPNTLSIYQLSRCSYFLSISRGAYFNQSYMAFILGDNILLAKLNAHPLDNEQIISILDGYLVSTINIDNYLMTSKGLITQTLLKVILLDNIPK